MNPMSVSAMFVLPSQVIWAYLVFAIVIFAGLVTMIIRGEWQRARGLEKLIALGPMFYAAPLAAFGSEHFTATAEIASLVPKWIPWHLFWAYFVGACFIAAGLSMATRIQARLAASLVALTFCLFVVVMDAPGWAHHPGNRFFAALTLRELSFSGGALALAASLMAGGEEPRRGARTQVFATIARYFIAVPVLFYCVEQFMHADHVPGVPLEMLTPQYVFGHAFWTYLAAAAYAVLGLPLLIGKRARTAATWLGATLVLVELVAYVPIAIVERASIVGFNYMADTLMFCGAVLLLAGAMPRQDSWVHPVADKAVAVGQ
jgi:uncharacterized membrane protein